MFTIKTTDQYTETLWKNGKGTTTELAISEGGSLSDFDWRISIAAVSENGVFSDFSGLRRDLFLLSGNGITLTHDEGNSCETVHHLNQPLDYATFDGGSRTEGELVDGAITDFNLMTRQGKYQVNIVTIGQQMTMPLPEEGICFIYPLTDTISIELENDEVTQIDKHYLLQAEHGLKGAELTAKNTILIQLVLAN